ncbi:MAG: thioredoxin TrxC [Epsilonproteobacteria bacterium]|nr:thioredoxin TrxC [Campylobacterota bacterium]
MLNIVCPYCLKVNRVPQKDSYKKVNCGYCKNSLLNPKVVEANTQTFNHFLQNSSIPLVVDFWAPWCGPCQMMAPAFKEAANAFPLKAQFLKVNTEENPQIAAQYGIRSIPTMIIFKNAQEVDRVSGALPASHIKEWVQRYI